MVFLIGIALIGLGVFLIFQQKQLTSKANLMQDTDTTTVEAINENLKEMSSSFGLGNFSLYSELKGIARTNNPLLSTFSKKPCVYYKTLITRKYEVLEERRDSNGNYHKTWATREDVVSSNEEKLEFELEDKTGKILVNMDGASVEASQVFDTFENGKQSSRFEDLFFPDSHNARTIGFRYTEFAIPQNAPVYVLGDANDRSGVLKIGRSTDREKRYIISTKSEEQMVHEAKSGATMAKYGSWASIVIGIGVLIYGLMKG
ncbi:MAG: E3 ubiquitin ligase family protein [Flammeovirgaceae bacterium]